MHKNISYKLDRYDEKVKLVLTFSSYCFIFKCINCIHDKK